MRYAHVYDGPGPDGRPSISADHDLLDAERAERLAAYLREGTHVLLAPGSKPDQVDPSREVGLATYTDGEWYWDEELIRYVGEYRLTPNAAFIDHVERTGFMPSKPTAEQVQELLAQLGL